MTRKAVLFDFGGVIMDMRWDVAARLEREHDLAAGSIVRTMYATPLWQDIQVGRRDADGHEDLAHAELEKLAGRSLPKLHHMWREAQNLIEDNLTLVRSLRTAVVTTVLSNAGNTLRGRLTDDLRIADLFADIVCSAEVGMAKPDPRIYALAAERIGLPPAECVFVDDGEVNVTAARDAGLGAVHYRVDRGDDLRALLAEAGVASAG